MSTTSSVIGNRIWKAVQLAQSMNVWIGVGKTSPWTDETAPPDVQGNEKALQELVALKKAEQVKLVIPDPTGTLEVNKVNYKEVAIADALTQDARYVYVATWLKYEEAPTVDYRQTGVFADVVMKATTPPGKLILLPDEIQNFGFLLTLNQRKPVSHSNDTKEFLEFIIEY